MADDPKLAAAMARLDALTDWERRPRNRMRVGLDSARDLAARLGNPQKAFRAVHVGGTKGKGSVSALIEAALARAGLGVGRYGSPHVERVTERVSLGGRDVDEATLASALTRALDAYEAARREGTAAADATWFDLLTLAAFVIFRDSGVKWAVVEVGLGGRLDSTNIIDGEIAVVTNIGLEHTEILGDTRAAIAGEKAGILKSRAVVVTTLAPDDEAGRPVYGRARALGCEVVRSDAGEGATVEDANAALAGAVLDALGRADVTAASGARVGAALLDADTRARARLIGRMERVTLDGLPVVLDGAHVPFNIAAVLRDLARAPELAGPCVAVAALARDKDAAGFLSELRGRRLWFAPTSHRLRAGALPRNSRRSRLRSGSPAKSRPIRGVPSGAASSLPGSLAPGCS
jgi:dihydrofolate synthase / folylpolyglutamate synthase